MYTESDNVSDGVPYFFTDPEPDYVPDKGTDDIAILILFSHNIFFMFNNIFFMYPGARTSPKKDDRLLRLRWMIYPICVAI